MIEDVCNIFIRNDLNGSAAAIVAHLRALQKQGAAVVHRSENPVEDVRAFLKLMMNAVGYAYCVYSWL